MGKELKLAVTPSANLRKTQAKLYEFILEKHKDGKTINLNEVIQQYSKYGCRNFIGNKPAYYRYDWKEHREFLEPLGGDLLKTYAIRWFIRNLGIFVVKGLLTAIPTLELADIKVLDEPVPTKKEELT